MKTCTVRSIGLYGQEVSNVAVKNSRCHGKGTSVFLPEFPLPYLRD